jgi:hypothetical protein
MNFAKIKPILDPLRKGIMYSWNNSLKSAIPPNLETLLTRAVD